MAKLAEIGDLVKDKNDRIGTVIGSTKKSLTVKFRFSTERIQFDLSLFELHHIGFKPHKLHEQVLFLMS